MTQVNEIRELTMDETDRASGGNPAVVGFVLGWAATKLLDDVASAGPSLLDIAKKAAAEKATPKGKDKC